MISSIQMALMSLEKLSHPLLHWDVSISNNTAVIEAGQDISQTESLLDNSILTGSKLTNSLLIKQEFQPIQLAVLKLVWDTPTSSKAILIQSVSNHQRVQWSVSTTSPTISESEASKTSKVLTLQSRSNQKKFLLKSILALPRLLLYEPNQNIN